MPRNDFSFFKLSLEQQVQKIFERRKILKIGIFFGAFCPPHLTHYFCISHSLKNNGGVCDVVLVAPHSLNKKKQTKEFLIPFELKVQMLAGDIKELKLEEKVYVINVHSFTTVESVKIISDAIKRSPQNSIQLFLINGSHDVNKDNPLLPMIQTLPNIIFIKESSPKDPLMDEIQIAQIVPSSPLSSTLVRAYLRQSSLFQPELNANVTQNTLSIIKKHKLFSYQP